jgi:putative MATE family efflux protein
MLYNIGAGILRAIGDSTRPFFFLIISALTNTVLDLFLVLVCGMGVEGVALATVIAQSISALLILITLMRSNSCVRVTLRDLRIHKDMLIKIAKVGFPAAIQMAITAFSNVFVQSYINGFGTDTMSGWTAYAKIDQLILLPMQSFSLASTTFVGQNLGVNDVPRAKRGIRTALLLAVSSTVILMIPVLLFAPQLTAFFNDKPEVIACGSLLLRSISPFYVLCCINQIYAAALRGSGDSRTPMIIILCSFVLFRQLYLFVVSRYISNTLIPLAMAYPAGWLVCSTAMFLYFRRASLVRHRLVENAD